MSSNKTMVLAAIFLAVFALGLVYGNPTMDMMSGYDFLGVCLRNCAQCKKMFGSYFEGQMCADACVKFKGKIIPDCEDIQSIAPFLHSFE